jgi:hypothetical protein
VVALDSARVSRRYATEREARVRSVVENGFRAKGFTIVSNPAGAEYGIWFIPNMKENTPTSGTVVGNSVYLDRRFVHQLTGYFYSLTKNGGPKQLLWEGTGFAAGIGADFEGGEQMLLKGLLERFPN